jgi:ribonuclease-3
MNKNNYKVAEKDISDYEKDISLNLNKLEKIIGYKFHNIDLLKKALTHKSYAAETGNSQYNERLEFLGDSILGSAVVDYLYNKYPDQNEGRLSQLKSQIVSGQNLSKWAKELKIGQYIFISKSEEASGGRKRDSLLADTIEALIASIYLDSGFSAAKNFVLRSLTKQRRLIVIDTKSKLQEIAQSKYKTLPMYKLMHEEGPDHEKIFEVGVYIKRKLLGTGRGRSKKEAEQSAAKVALKTLRK